MEMTKDADRTAVSVVVVDDHSLVRRGLEQLLTAEPDIDVVGSARDGEDALRIVARTSPDVVLMDLQMPGMDGIEATRRLVATAPQLPVVVLTSFSDRERILAALDAGAVGYLLKDAEPQELIDGVHAAARAESPLDPRAARELLSSRRSVPGSGGSLTAREREVLELVREGLANKQVARRMGISERTVKAHLTSVFQRIGVSDRTQAALWAQQHLGPPG